jgi:hypothetical protein
MSWTTTPVFASLPTTMSSTKTSPIWNRTTTAATTTESTATFLSLSSDDMDIVKIAIPVEHSLTTTKICLIVILTIFTCLACGVALWAVLKYLKKKNINFVDIVVRRQNEEVVLPDQESPLRAARPENEHLPYLNIVRIEIAPTVRIRERIESLGRYFTNVFVDRVSQNIDRRFRRRQQQQQQQENIELGEIQNVIPDFEPFPGFDLSQFRLLVAAFCNPRFFEPNYCLENDPDRVFHFFPSDDCMA